MTAPWEPEAAVDARLAADLLARAFPRLAGRRVTLLGAGWDNTAFRVGDDLVARFVRRAVAVDLLATEVRWLAFLAPHLPLPVPAPTDWSPPLPPHPFPFAVHPWLPGTCGDALNDAPADRRAMAPALGAFLRALHAVPVPEGAPVDAFRKADHAGRLPARHALVEELAGALPVPATRVHAALDALATAAPWPGPPVWVHGDLHPRHLLVHDGRLAGVIDWGDLHTGDPALDLSIAFTWLDAEGRTALLDAHGPVDADTLARARTVAIHYGLVLLKNGLATGDAHHLRTATHALAQATGEAGAGTE